MGGSCREQRQGLPDGLPPATRAVELGLSRRPCSGQTSLRPPFGAARTRPSPRVARSGSRDDDRSEIGEAVGPRCPPTPPLRSPHSNSVRAGPVADPQSDQCRPLAGEELAVRLTLGRPGRRSTAPTGRTRRSATQFKGGSAEACQPCRIGRPRIRMVPGPSWCALGIRSPYPRRSRRRRRRAPTSSPGCP